MVADAQSREFVTTVRPISVRRGPLTAAVAAICVFGVVFGIAAVQGAPVGALVMFLFFSAVIVLAAWLVTRGLGRSTFVIDAAGLELHTPRGNRRLAWSDVDSATVATEKDAHLLLVTLRPGVQRPVPSALGVPRWSSQRHCVVVIQVESFDTSPTEVAEALRRHGGDAFRADGRL
jgi:hypothetical protein